MISIQKLVGGYANSSVIKGIDIEVEKGEFFALLGPNGSGKTTLFKLITGQLPITSGRILLSDKTISSYSKLEKAKKVAVLTQEIQVSFDYTVEEIVSLGRYPHQKGFLKKLSKADWNVIEEVMNITKIGAFRKKQFRSISGGEKQRVLLAKALAQEPELLLLDEPTNHLDIKHTFQILDLLKERQQTMGLTIFAILHDLNVASLYADRFGLLNDGRLLDTGDVDVLRNEEQLREVYEVQVITQSHPTIPKPQLLMTPKYAISKDNTSFHNLYKINQTAEQMHIQFDQPLRTISNSTYVDGIQWIKDFYILKNENESNLKDLIYSKKQSAVTTVDHPQNTIIVKKEIENIQMVIFTAFEVQDVTSNERLEGNKCIGKIITKLFIDSHFTDGAIVQGLMFALSGRDRAMQNVDSKVKNVASSLTEPLVFGVTQRGMKVATGELENKLGKAIEEAIYSTTNEMIKRCL